ncbi:Thaumatin family [Dillenia turbinata]|uniref:Thaumatin family n=1 Tax=Dillenia turbinata TaxID=194707 RepID=A0AAN8ZM69_9MAGN
MAQVCLVILMLSLAIPHFFLTGVDSATFTIANKCDYTVWPGLLSGAGTPPLSTTGFSLQNGESKTISTPTNWSGRIWGRTYCTQDSSGKFSCLTGDCGSGKVECSGSGAAPPATLAEFTLDGSGGLDYYDVSLVDGYNLAMMVVAQGGSAGNCSSTGCVVDLNESCPTELRVTGTDGQSVACKSACEAFASPQYCCSGEYGGPDTCKPTSYSQLFKSACPRAYSYAYDDKTSTFTCASADYRPVVSSTKSLDDTQKSSQGGDQNQGSNPQAADLPQVTNSTMTYEGADNGGDEYNSAAPNNHTFRSQLIAGGIALLTTFWRLVLHF